MRQRTLDENFERTLAADLPRMALERRRSRLRSLLALSLILCSFSILGTGAVFVAMDANPAARAVGVASLVNQVGVVAQAVSAAYAGQSGYDALDDSIVVRGGAVPQGMMRDGAIVNAFGGAIHVAAADGGFVVTATAVPGWACARIAAMDVGDGMTAVTVKAGGVTDASYDGPMGLKVAAKACSSSSGLATVSWSFR